MTLTGCYYMQAVHGQLAILAKRKPIEKVIRDPTTKSSIKSKLKSVLQMRSFASDQLSLPDNKSYTSYVQLDRRYVVWNVYAAPKYSLKPEQWCFLVVGCVNYRGYFNKQNAIDYAQTLKDDDLDTFVAGIPAYSTLGWFNDPVLSSILRYPDSEVAEIIFHELAHQVVYVKNDTAFNESFATAVGREGVKRWLMQTGNQKELRRYYKHKKYQDKFISEMMSTKKQLESIYKSNKSVTEKKALKAKAFADLKQKLTILAKSDGNIPRLQKWLGQNFGNAHLAPVVLYNKYLPAFRALLEECNGDLPAFYQAVKKLAKQSKSDRDKLLRSYGAHIN